MDVIPHVMKGEMYPVQWEEWIELIVGLGIGPYVAFGNYYQGKTCKAALVTVGLSASNISGWFDKGLPTNALGWIFGALGPAFTLVLAFLGSLKCLGEGQLNNAYQTYRAKVGDNPDKASEAAAEIEPDLDNDVFNLISRLQSIIDYADDDGEAIMDEAYKAPMW